jgi:hypothetical protein
LKQNIAELTEARRLEVLDLTQKLQAQVEEKENNIALRKKAQEMSKTKITKVRGQKVSFKRKSNRPVLKLRASRNELTNLKDRQEHMNLRIT